VLTLIAMAVLRAIGMRASKDALTLKADASERDAYDRLTKRVELLDSRLNELETVRSHLFGFVTKCMAYISQCQACSFKNADNLAEIEKGYKEMVALISNRKGEENNETSRELAR